MDFLKNQTKYTVSFKYQLIIATTLGLFLSFILIFLEPFNTNEFESEFKTEILLGFGIVFLATYIIYSRIENFYYYKKSRVWKIINELVSSFLFLIIAGTVILFYNLWINRMVYSISDHIRYFKNIIFAFLPLILPLLYLLRNKFGELITQSTIDQITINGMNKNEKLELKRQDLLFVKASENYSMIYFVKDNNIQHKTFRNTLSNINMQASFLEKCHRSYLVNVESIDEVVGNSQSAKLIFSQYDGDIPVSKTYYKKIVQLLK